MATVGPIKLNRGWVSDGDFWNPGVDGSALTFSGLVPWNGGYKTLDGIQAATWGVLPSATECFGFFYWQDPAQEGVGSRDIVIAFQNSKVYTQIFSDTNNWTDRSAAVALPAGGYWTFGILNSIAIFGNSSSGTYSPFKLTSYTSNIAALGGSPPKSNIVKVVNNYVFISQDLSAAGKMSRLYYSNVADPETWGAANYVDVRINDGDIITALASLGTDVIIFKTNSIWRFSTNSTAIAGSPTLGPLTCINDRIGCVGPLAVDAMPDGSLVFLAQNGHLYQTDGLTFIDLSHRTWPHPNIRLGFNVATGANPYFGPIYNTMVKVDGEEHRIFVSTLPQAGNARYLFVYDYSYDAWGDWSVVNGGSNTYFFMNTMPRNLNPSTAGYGGVEARLYFATDNGFIRQAWGPFLYSPLRADLSGITCTLEITIPLGGMGPADFIPRSLVVPIRQPNSVAGLINVYIGYDGTYGSAALTASLAASKRFIVPIGEKTGSTFKHPITMQVKITLVGGSTLGATIIEPIYISDEVLT